MRASRASEDKPATYGLDQAKTYQRTAKRLNVPFVIATNGHQWTLHDNRNATTIPLPRPMAEFPTPTDLREGYEDAVGINLSAPLARSLINIRAARHATRRYSWPNLGEHVKACGPGRRRPRCRVAETVGQLRSGPDGPYGTGRARRSVRGYGVPGHHADADPRRVPSRPKLRRWSA